MWKILSKIHVSHLLVGWSVVVIVAMVWCGVFGVVGSSQLKNLIGSEIVISGTVIEDVENDGSALLLRMGDLEIQEIKVDGMIYVKLSTEERIQRSDKITLSGKVSEGFGVFVAAMWRPSLISLIKPNPPDVALAARDWFGGLVRQYIPAPQADLALGYLLGQKKALPEYLSTLLTEVGLTHIVVASGYNLSILVGGVRKMFRRVSRFAAAFFAVLLVASFMGVVGLSASMVRAGLVAFLGIFAWYAGRKFHPVKLLLFVASITLLMNPVYIMDLGWLLSFASFAGVMIVGPILLAYFYGDRKPNFLVTVLLETVAAQICCLPIILYFSGSMSLVSLAANVLILPTIPITMALTFAAGVMAMFSVGAGAAVFGGMANMILTYHIGIVEFFGGMKWAISKIEAGNMMVLWIYLIIIVAVYYMKRKAEYRLIGKNMVELC